MADETTNTGTGTGTDPAAVQAAEAARQAAETEAKAAKAAEAARIVALEQRVGALTDSLRAVMGPARTTSGTGGSVVVPDNFRALLRQQGMTDADIDANGPLIMPFLGALLATEGRGIVAAIEGIRTEIDMVKAGRNHKKYPDWADLEEKIVEIRTEAAKRGEAVSVDAAYHAAVAGNLEIVEESRARRKAASSAADASANTGVAAGNHARGARGGGERTALTAEDLASMPAADRKKFFESVANLPIR